MRAYGIPKNEFNDIYVKPIISKAEGVFLASPSPYTYWKNYLTEIYYDGYVSTGCVSTYYREGFRPIVCLKSGLKIEKNPSTGNYRIVK